MNLFKRLVVRSVHILFVVTFLSLGCDLFAADCPNTMTLVAHLKKVSRLEQRQMDDFILGSPEDIQQQLSKYFKVEKENPKINALLKMGAEEAFEFMRLELFQALSTGYGLLGQKELLLLRAWANEYILDGGVFSVRYQDIQHGTNSALSFLDQGFLNIDVPYLELMQAHAQVGQFQRRIVSAMIHELRHHISILRVRRKLATRGHDLDEGFRQLNRLVIINPGSWTSFVGQLEDEAKDYEQRFIPDEIEGKLSKFTYAEAEYFTRLINGRHDEDELKSQLSNAADRVNLSIEAYLNLFTEERPLNGEMSYYLTTYRYGATKYGKNFAFKYITQNLVDDVMSGFASLLSKEAYKEAKQILIQRMPLQKRVISTTLHSLLKRHPGE